MPDDILPGARLITPESSAPIAINENPDDDSRPVRSPKSSGRSASPGAGRSTRPPSDADSPEPADSPAIKGRVQYRRCDPHGASWRAISLKYRSMNRFAGPPAMSSPAIVASVTLTGTTPGGQAGPDPNARRIATFG